MARTATADESGFVSKITGATLGCKPEIVKGKEVGTKAPLYRILGKASGIKETKDTNGEIIYGLTGDFEGTNLVTNETMKSGVAFLPPGIHDMLLKQLDDGLADNAGRFTIQFAMDIYSVAATNKSGYTYEAKDLLPAEMTADPFSAFRDQLKDAPKLTADQQKLIAAG